jgi:SAM-dependent methyltransferase
MAAQTNVSQANAPAPVPTGNAYDKYAASNPIERRLMQGFLRTLDRFLPTAPPATVLEVGMGEGEIAARIRQRYPQTRFVGIDLPDDELAAAWGDKGVSGAFADIAHLPFPSSHFDLVLAIEVLEHVPDPDAALRELARVGRASFVLSVPDEPIWRVANMARGKYLRDLGNTPGHIQHWSQRSFRRQVGAHLDVESSASPFPWTMVSARIRRPTST